jgi:hypothetical protein
MYVNKGSRIAIIAGIAIAVAVAGIVAAMSYAKPSNTESQNVQVNGANTTAGSTGKNYVIGLNESLGLKENH